MSPVELTVVEEPLVQLLLLLGAAVAIVALFQRLKTPPVLGYLLVGVLLGPYTPGPVIEGHQLRLLAEYGIVFLLFTIGLNFSLPQIHALRHLVLGLGTAQVLLTTAAIGAIAWLAGVPPAAAFVVGAVFAQSSSTIIGRLLQDQGEEQSRHGRLGLAMSVFQDVTAAPLIVVIPVLGLGADAGSLATSIGWVLAKAALAFVIVYFAGRALIGPFFRAIAEHRSAELFTLTALFVSLTAAWLTSSLGLSMAFGAFLVGMTLGETEFRHQVESAVRPFRDVLLGLFFIGIGMLFDLSAIPDIWHLALAGAAVLLVTKVLLVAPMVRWAGIDWRTAWRVALLLAVGGEFGFALLAIGFQAGVVEVRVEQVVLMSVLLSMVLAPYLIRHNGTLAEVLARPGVDDARLDATRVARGAAAQLVGHVVVCGYGRVGHTVATLLETSGVPFIAYDTDLARVAQGNAAGHLVLYGDIADPALLAAGRADRASLIVITIDQTDTALRTVSALRALYPQLPIIARARDLETSGRLLAAGATQAYPEAIEASLRLGATALQMVGTTSDRVDLLLQGVRDRGYDLVRDDAAQDPQPPREPR
jgi:CPA2 family monovalent cation:H+ antiporter-2